MNPLDAIKVATNMDGAEWMFCLLLIVGAGAIGRWSATLTAAQTKRDVEAKEKELAALNSELSGYRANIKRVDLDSHDAVGQMIDQNGGSKL